jgi:ankyrin repeat protein
MWASIGGYLPVVQALLKAGADPNATAEVSPLSANSSGDAAGRSWVSHATGGLTALMFAARQGQSDVAQALLDSGAKPNYATPDGLTALIIAVINDRLDLAAMMINKGANPNDGSLYEAVQIHNSRVVEQNMDATRPKIWHENKTTPVELIGLMLDHGALPGRLATHALNMPGSGGQKGIVMPVNASAYARAIQAQDVAVVKAMLAKGANPNAGDNGALPLALAVGGGGGGRGGVFGVRASPLRFDSERTVEGTVNALLAGGANVNATDRTGNTPLHAAAQSGNVPMIQLLVEKGAKLDFKNNGGFIPLDIAMGKGAPPPGPPGFGGGGGFGRGGGPQPRPEAIVELRKLMGLPPLSPEEMPKPAPGRGGPLGGM